MTAAASPLTLPVLTELLIMWLVPNFFFGWKVGGGGGLQTFTKINGQYVHAFIAFAGSVLWILTVNFWMYPLVAIAVENFYANIDPKNYPLIILIQAVVAYAVFRKEHWA